MADKTTTYAEYYRREKIEVEANIARLRAIDMSPNMRLSKPELIAGWRAQWISDPANQDADSKEIDAHIKRAAELETELIKTVQNQEPRARVLRDAEKLIQGVTNQRPPGWQAFAYSLAEFKGQPIRDTIIPEPIAKEAIEIHAKVESSFIVNQGIRKYVEQLDHLLQNNRRDLAALKTSSPVSISAPAASDDAMQHLEQQLATAKGLSEADKERARAFARKTMDSFPTEKGEPKVAEQALKELIAVRETMNKYDFDRDARAIKPTDIVKQLPAGNPILGR